MSPRRPDPGDHHLPGQPILPFPSPGIVNPITLIYECATCGGRNFAIDQTRPSIDPRWAVGKCRERPDPRRTCAGKIARAISL